MNRIYALLPRGVNAADWCSAVDRVEKKAFSDLKRSERPRFPAYSANVAALCSQDGERALFVGKIHLCCPAAVTTAMGWASIQIDMKLQKETKREPRDTAWLNHLVFGVALLWLATSLLLLLMYHSSPAHAVQPNRASPEQKLAVVARPAAAKAPFTH